MGTTSDYGLGEYKFPRGWFMVAEAAELDSGPIAVRFFANDFVIFRGASGRIVMLDAYCPHMGTHLCRNTTSYIVRDGTQVQGDSIRCPYHAWRFGPDGVCDDIPYAGRIPAAARVRSYIAVERAGAIFMWHDPEDMAPDFDLPEFAQWDDPAWVRWKFDHMGELPSHPIEILYNLADMAHLGPVHAAPVEYFEDEIKGHICIQRQGGRSRTLVDGDALLETDSWYLGHGVMQSTMTGQMDSLMIIAHTPVDDGVTKVWHALMVKGQGLVDGRIVATDADTAVARAYQEASRQAFAQDFEIWTHKKPATNIMQLPEDGPFHKVKLWISQFYNPRSRTAEILARAEGFHGAGGMPRTKADMAA
jgi:3-ketosteroid 9alpha-monooxygenase subunit A